MNITLMAYMGVEVVAGIVLALTGGAVGVAGFYGIKNLVYAIQGKPITRWLFRRRTKGQQNLFMREKPETKTPAPSPEPEEETFWPRVLKRIRITAKLKAGKWNQGEFKDAEDKQTMLKKLNRFLEENLQDPNVTSLEFTFADPVGRYSNNFLQFTIRRGAKRPSTLREERAKQITELIYDIEKYALENDGVFTEEVSKAFKERADEINASTRKVKVNAKNEQPNATFLDDTKTNAKNNYTVIEKNGIKTIVYEDCDNENIK